MLVDEIIERRQRRCMAEGDLEIEHGQHALELSYAEIGQRPVFEMNNCQAREARGLSELALRQCRALPCLFNCATYVGQRHV